MVGLDVGNSSVVTPSGLATSPSMVTEPFLQVDFEHLFLDFDSCLRLVNLL